MTANTKTMSELKTMWKLSMGSLVQASVCTLTSGVVKAAAISAKSSDKLVAFVGEQAGNLYVACQNHLQKDSQVPGYARHLRPQRHGQARRLSEDAGASPFSSLPAAAFRWGSVHAGKNQESFSHGGQKTMSARAAADQRQAALAWATLAPMVKGLGDLFHMTKEFVKETL